MIEYILVLLLTSGVIFLAYKAGKRAGIKEEQLRQAQKQLEEQINAVQVIAHNSNLNEPDIDTWLQERADKSDTNMPTEF